MLRTFHILLSFYPDLSDRCIADKWLLQTMGNDGLRLVGFATSDELVTDIGKVHAQLVSSCSFISCSHLLMHFLTMSRLCAQLSKQADCSFCASRETSC